MITRYAITHCDANGSRRLTFNSNSRDTFATKEQAQKHLAAVAATNSADNLRDIYGPHVMKTLKVQPITCYESGDPAPGDEPISPYMVAELHAGGFGLLNLASVKLLPHRVFKIKANAVAACLKLNA